MILLEVQWWFINARTGIQYNYYNWQTMIGWCFFWDAEQIWRVFPGYLWMMMMILSNHNFQISHSSTTVWGLLFIHMAAAQNVSGPDPYPGRSIPLIYTLLNRYTSFEIICVFPLFHTSRSLHNDPLHNDPYTFLSHSHVYIWYSILHLCIKICLVGGFKPSEKY